VRVPKDEVLIRWAYSEINSPEQGYLYEDVADLAAVPFSALTTGARNRLLRQWLRARGASIFAEALSNVPEFQLQQWTKDELGSVYIIPYFHRWLASSERSRNFTFQEWIETEPHGELSSHHPLLIRAYGPFKQEHPVTVGLLHGQTRLLDGYHRAVPFWRSAESTAKLAVYVPLNRNGP
jgi:hypothetical protein